MVNAVPTNTYLKPTNLLLFVLPLCYLVFYLLLLLFPPCSFSSHLQVSFFHTISNLQIHCCLFFLCAPFVLPTLPLFPIFFTSLRTIFPRVLITITHTANIVRSYKSTTVCFSFLFLVFYPHSPSSLFSSPS